MQLICTKQIGKKHAEQAKKVLRKNYAQKLACIVGTSRNDHVSKLFSL